MSRPRLLDLFCCAGGAGMGFYRAGFDVIGVDVVRHERYPFSLIEADVLDLPPEWIASEFQAVHASPPCQFATLLKHAPGGREHPNLIPATRDLLLAAGIPYVIENVEPARAHMRDPITLCGTMFGLGSQGCELRRHRLIEASFVVRQPVCRHTDGPVIGVYGGHARKRSARHGGRGTRDSWAGGHKVAASEAMGIDWMTLNELSEAIPPAYTEFVGRQLMDHLRP